MINWILKKMSSSYKRYGKYSFSYIGPVGWNNLLREVRQATGFHLFKLQTEISSFQTAFNFTIYFQSNFFFKQPPFYEKTVILLPFIKTQIFDNMTKCNLFFYLIHKITFLWQNRPFSAFSSITSCYDKMYLPFLFCQPFVFMATHIFRFLSFKCTHFVYLKKHEIRQLSNKGLQNFMDCFISCFSLFIGDDLKLCSDNL